MKQGVREPEYQAKLMTESFGKERARVMAIAAAHAAKMRTQREYWERVRRNIPYDAPPPPPPPTPAERAEKWAMLSGFTYRILDNAIGHYIEIPVNQARFGYVKPE